MVDYIDISTTWNLFINNLVIWKIHLIFVGSNQAGWLRKAYESRCVCLIKKMITNLVIWKIHLIFVESNERKKLKFLSTFREKSIKISLTNLVVRNFHLIFVKSIRNRSDNVLWNRIVKTIQWYSQPRQGSSWCWKCGGL